MGGGGKGGTQKHALSRKSVRKRESLFAKFEVTFSWHETGLLIAPASTDVAHLCAYASI